jgi:flagella basal body P-ring formation protein FlgA
MRSALVSLILISAGCIAASHGLSAQEPERTVRPAPRITPRVAPPDVKRGDKVLVSVISGRVLLSFEAETESAGHIGESVIVKNPETGRRFVARVEEPGKVIVKK